MSSFFKSFYYTIYILIFAVIFITCFFTPIINGSDGEMFVNESDIIISNLGFAWPIPGYTKITSYFGKRNSPTAGASSYHKGLDIGAPEGTNLIATIDGKITYIGFLGGGGYTITLSKENMKITYCHVSPNFIVKVGDEVKKGQIIGNVGPKYVYGVPGNTYYDENGKPTNGATTGTHLHLGIRVDEQYMDPLNYYK